jgi:ABC-type Co2+ transport system permease subunit
MSLLGVWVGYGTFLLCRKVLKKTKASVVLAAAFAAFLSVPAAAIGFVIQYAIGGNATYSVTTVLAGMVSTHILIGIGEAVITGMAISAVLASRPDLVYGWKPTANNLEIRKAQV